MDKFPPLFYNDNMMNERKATMEISEMDREWVASMAGRKVTDQEIKEFLVEWNSWLDSLDDSPEIYGGN